MLSLTALRYRWKCDGLETYSRSEKRNDVVVDGAWVDIWVMALKMKTTMWRKSLINMGFKFKVTCDELGSEVLLFAFETYSSISVSIQFVIR